MDDWIELLSQMSLTQPYSAYAVFTRGLSSKWTYLSKTISNIQPLLQPLEDAISKSFLPHLTGQNTFSCQLRGLLALPSRLGGLSNWLINLSLFLTIQPGSPGPWLESIHC